MIVAHRVNQTLTTATDMATAEIDLLVTIAQVLEELLSKVEFTETPLLLDPSLLLGDERLKKGTKDKRSH